jgi:hypothetical protein
MGLATSTDLFNWTQQDDPIFNFTQLGSWATPQVEDLQFQAQFRDPFVMPDPDVPGHWLMYFVTISALSSPATIVGFAKSDGDFSNWTDDRPLYRTVHPTGARAESPHVFARDGRWWLFYTAAEDANPRVFATHNDNSPTDTDTTNWSAAQDINALIVDEFTGEPTDSYVYWKGSELLEISAINDVSFLAAYNDQVVGISYTLVRTAESPYLFEEHCPLTPLAVGNDAGQVSDARLFLLGPRPARSLVGLRIELPSAMPVHLAIYDVAGRRIRTLVNGGLPGGATELKWDGRGDGGAALRSGLYFASLRAGADRRSVRVPLIR